jgi:hypothetical protein
MHVQRMHGGVVARVVCGRMVGPGLSNVGHTGGCKERVKRVETRTGASTWREWGRTRRRGPITMATKATSEGETSTTTTRRMRTTTPSEWMGIGRMTFPGLSLSLQHRPGLLVNCFASRTNRLSPPLPRAVFAHLPVLQRATAVQRKCSLPWPPSFPPVRLLRAPETQPHWPRCPTSSPDGQADEFCGSAPCATLCTSLLSHCRFVVPSTHPEPDPRP